LEGGGEVQALAFSKDNRCLVAAVMGDDIQGQPIRIWDLTTRVPFEVRSVGYPTGVQAVVITPDSRWLITAGNKPGVQMWDLASRDPAVDPVVLRGADGAADVLAISPDGNYLACGGDDGTARLWLLRQSTASLADDIPVLLNGHDGPISAMTVSPDNHYLITAGEDRAIRVWNLQLDELVTAARTAAQETRNNPCRTQSPFRRR
jgi:WD40 repeat protein